MDIEIQGVKITLTPQQLEEIARQTAKSKVEDINDIKDAEKVLEKLSSHTKYIESHFVRTKDWLQYQLETIIKASNFIDNDYKEYIPNFLDRNTYKYIPWLERKSSGWVVDCVVGYCYSSYCPAWSYFKKKETATLIVNKHLDLYNKVWG